MNLLKRLYIRMENILCDSRIRATKFETKRLKYPTVTIISNNCWGGWVYRFFGLPYQSPTIGLFFLSDDYLKFILNLKEYLNKELYFIKPEDAHEYKKVKEYVPKFGNYPIGRIDDVDIHFLHYESKEEAYEKWNKRKERIDYSRVIIKISKQNLWEDKFIEEFDKFNFPNKLFFTNKQYKCNSVKQVVFRRDYKYSETRNEGRYYHWYINILKYINSSKDTSSFF